MSKTTIEVPENLVERLLRVTRRVAPKLDDRDQSSRLVEIAILTRGLDALERQYPETALPDVEPKAAAAKR